MAYFFITFFVYSFIGFILETAFAILTRGILESRKTMRILPLCPVYGIGSLLLIYILNPFKASPVAVIILGSIAGTVAEYIYGYLATSLFGVTIWDYSGMKTQYNGIISLPFVAIWGILSAVLIYIVNPVLSPILVKFPAIITLFLFVFFAVDLYFTLKMLKDIGNGKNTGSYFDCPVIKQKNHR